MKAKFSYWMISRSHTKKNNVEVDCTALLESTERYDGTASWIQQNRITDPLHGFNERYGPASWSQKNGTGGLHRVNKTVRACFMESTECYGLASCTQQNSTVWLYGLDITARTHFMESTECYLYYIT
ncbi:hypothetical protein ACJMK2_022746 [Sinanodonta woodiana]|uniref:Uncharacterized protein n=1 Tax=Sinanodonta woodiana TaxID=1069815 RepID=A0ABD3TJY9_SINWO